ncbi:hypothetical protein T459_21695 [Capsicum annuum]|uniref:Uncharacterized protein n=1 Tax=Capsicum annuum TaxID=4072 RepID=A0A2G2YXC9_CAPAN|nr:hypothetical protein FXO37_22093 [Capsicum annuum]PHT74418.1 hypothetical protein T459_21695 [Capsicum annuum]
MASSSDKSVSTSEMMDNKEAAKVIDALSLTPSLSNASISASQMSLKFKIVNSIGEECIKEDGLLNLLAKKPQPICLGDPIQP